MAYLGSKPSSGFITTAKQRITSSTNNYVDLDNAISSLADVILWVNFVKQDSTNLSLTTSTRITLGGTLVSSDIVEIAYLGKAVATQNPSTNSVTNDMLVNSSITLNGSAVSLGGSATVGGTNTPNFSITRNSNQTGVSDNTETKIQFNNVQYDTASGWDSSNYWWVVPSGQGGKYYISWSAYLSGGGNGYIDKATLFLYGGTGTNAIDVVELSAVNNNFDTIIHKGSGIYSLSAGDKINVYALINVDGGTARIDGSGTWNYTHLQLAKIIE